MAYQDNGNVNVDKITVSRNNAVEGAIGVSTSIDGTLYIAGDSGIQFRSDDILPTNSSGAYTGGVLDIGDAGARFRAIYLSDGVNFGDAGGSGTSISNTLDSYEEGTWEPAIEYDTNGTLSVAYSQRNGAYTKVGNMVTIWGVIRLNGFTKGTASGSLKFTGLPFSSTATGYRTDLKVLSYRAPFNGPGGFGAMIDNGASYIACVYSRNNDTWIAEADPDSNSEYFFAGSYFTS
jgi:hypothetical protein